MYDAISGSGGLKGRRSFKKKSSTVISASLGARRGRVADVDRGPPTGVPSRRRARRIPTTLQIQIEGGWRRVAADISAGGALLLLPERIEDRMVVISVELKDGSRKWQAEGEIIRRLRRGDRIAHHVRFTRPGQVRGLGEVIDRCFAERQDRLETA